MIHNAYSHSRIGLSEAGKRIRAAGFQFQQKRRDGGDPPPRRAEHPIDIHDTAPPRSMDARMRKVGRYFSLPEWERRLLSEISERRGINPEEFFIKGKRSPEVSLARGEFYYRIKQHKNPSVKGLAKLLSTSAGRVTYSIALYCEETGLPFPEGLVNGLERARSLNREAYRRRRDAVMGKGSVT